MQKSALCSLMWISLINSGNQKKKKKKITSGLGQGRNKLIKACFNEETRAKYFVNPDTLSCIDQKWICTLKNWNKTSLGKRKALWSNKEVVTSCVDYRDQIRNADLEKLIAVSETGNDFFFFNLLPVMACSLSMGTEAAWWKCASLLSNPINIYQALTLCQALN